MNAKNNCINNKDSNCINNKDSNYINDYEKECSKFLVKIMTLKDLEIKVKDLKKQGKTIVFTNGCFDILHVGHIRYLAGASGLGDFLITAINSDESVRVLKGPGRPAVNQDERAEIIAALSFVDAVVIFSEKNVIPLLRTLKPHFHAKGTDYTEDTVPEKHILQEFNGRVAIIGDPKNHDSSKMISGQVL
jgi:rfaE bifunctional protein nucleotidyltransferase chain/domain